jgi:hypothetical protein
MTSLFDELDAIADEVGLRAFVNGELPATFRAQHCPDLTDEEWRDFFTDWLQQYNDKLEARLARLSELAEERNKLFAARAALPRSDLAARAAIDARIDSIMREVKDLRTPKGTRSDSS